MFFPIIHPKADTLGYCMILLYVCCCVKYFLVQTAYIRIVVRLKPVTELVILITHCEIGITSNELNQPFRQGYNETLSPILFIYI